MVRTRIRDVQSQDIGFLQELEFNEFFQSVVITGTVDATSLTQTFAEYFPGQGLIIGSGVVTVTTGTNGIVIEAASAAAAGVSSLNTLSGTITIEGAGEVFVTTAGQIITVSGTDHTSAGAAVPNAIIGVGEVVVTSGVSTTVISGTPHPPDEDDVDSINTVTGTVTLADAGKVVISTAGQTITVSGLPDDVDVDSIIVSGTSFTGDVTILGVGGVIVEPGADPNLITVSGEAVVTTSGQVVDDDFITINRARFGYGKNGNVNGAYLRVEGAASTETGHVMMRDARLTGVAAFYPDGAADKRFEVRKNGDPTVLFEVVAFVGVPTIIDELEIDFDIGDRIQVFVTSSGTSVKDPNFWGEVGWRAT